MQSTPGYSARPIFLIGAPRSGTTMLRYMLCAHPHIYIPPESNFIPRFYHAGSAAPLTRSEAMQVLTTILSYKVFFRDWSIDRPDPAAFVDGLPDRQLATLLDGLYGRYAAQHGARRWGDKSPIYTSHVEEIAAIFPAAQFIHIIRDGRDVALSMLKAYQGPRFFYVDICYAALSWKRRVQKARAAGRQLGPERYLELQYEQVTADPENHLHRICTFLDEPYVAEMLEPHKVARTLYHSRGIHAATRGPLTGHSAGRWQREMTAADQRILQAIAGDLLDDLGYETINLGRLTLGDYVRLAILKSKFAAIETGRRTLQSAGIFHPTSLLTNRRVTNRP